MDLDLEHSTDPSHPEAPFFHYICSPRLIKSHPGGSAQPALVVVDSNATICSSHAPAVSKDVSACLVSSLVETINDRCALLDLRWGVFKGD